MSDTPGEMHDHSRFIGRAHGDVLIAGLGLGMVACAVAAKPEVTAITVLENSEDVIKLVGKSLPTKVQVLPADVFTWKPNPGETWDCMWIDIWDAGCVDNLPEMTRLRRKYCRRVRDKIGCWSEERLRCIMRRERHEDRRWFR